MTPGLKSFTARRLISLQARRAFGSSRLVLAKAGGAKAGGAKITVS